MHIGTAPLCYYTEELSLSVSPGSTQGRFPRAAQRNRPHDTHGGFLRCDGKRAVESPETVSAMLANAGCPPGRIRAESGDSETYFPRAVHAGAVHAGGREP